ncbi:MAG TPA: NADPH-dependent F420 reductase [Burkholderiales bacterium]|nr:NADPH-dependent F420 reductase [Burkholderiales bacterium]
MKQSRREFVAFVGAAIVVSALPFPVFAQSKMKIGIVGSGNVGGAIGATWVRAGHEVMFSSRNIEHDKELAKRLGGGAKAGTPREAVTFGEVVMISVPYHALPSVGKDLADVLKGKIVIDTNNPFTHRDGETGKWALEKGAGLASAELLPGTRLVRAFNAIAAAKMGAAYQEPGKVGMPIASDDAKAAEIASRLIRDVGYEPVLIGGLEKGKYLMPGTPLAGERSADEIKKIAAGLN